MCDNLEVFSSKVFGSEMITTGKDAPTAFREALSIYAKSKKTMKLEVLSLTQTESGGVFSVNIKNGRSKFVSVFSVLLDRPNFIAFID